MMKTSEQLKSDINYILLWILCEVSFGFPKYS